MGISSIDRYERKTEFLIGKATPEVIERRREFSKELRRRRSQRKRKIDFAEELKQKPTRAEKILESALRSTAYHICKKSGKVHFLNPTVQLVVHGYIADFAFRKAKIIIEVDGGYHKNREQYDLRRDDHLQKAGWTTLRLSNEQVMANPKGIAQEISIMVRRILHPEIPSQ